jgi:hypothetical protein
MTQRVTAWLAAVAVVLGIVIFARHGAKPVAVTEKRRMNEVVYLIQHRISCALAKEIKRLEKQLDRPAPAVL